MSQMSSSLQKSLSDQLRRHKALQMTPITLCHHGWTLNSSLSMAIVGRNQCDGIGNTTSTNDFSSKNDLRI